MSSPVQEVNETCIHHLLEAHAREHPDKEAVVYSTGDSLSWSAILLDGVEAVVGPCLNTGPVVVSVSTALLGRRGEEDEDGEERLLNEVERFSSTVVHMQRDAMGLFEDDESRGAVEPSGEARCRVGWVGGTWDSADVAMETRLVGKGTDKGSVKVALHFCEKIVGTEVTEAMMRMLCAWIARFCGPSVKRLIEDGDGVEMGVLPVSLA